MVRDAVRAVLRLCAYVALAALLVGGARFTLSAMEMGLHGSLWQTHCRRPPIDETRMRVLTAQNAIVQFQIEAARCPTGEHELVEGRFLSGAQKDSWGTGFEYRCRYVGGHLNLQVTSAGPDRTFHTADDISETLD